MASLAPLPRLAGTPLARRLHAEFALLTQLAQRNPTRLSSLQSADTTLRVTLHGTPALPHLAATHRLRVDYPRYFPTVPLELYLESPAQHPNIHPITGFICLWDQHRVTNNIEHALHKTVAILGWQLLNLNPEHVMQHLTFDLQATRARLAAPPLTGVSPQQKLITAPGRKRLS